jgi:hypothetical protein
LSPTSVERVLALLGEHDLEAPGDVEGALELIAGREDEGAPVEISRYDLQLFLWYQLPCKLLASFEVKRAVAERLGRFLELAGDGATAYAEICTSEQTMAMLEAWEVEEPDTVERLREALEASGLEPPDTDVLRWRSMMGFEEGRLRDRVARELEQWIEGAGVDPGAREFKRRQAALVAEFLQRAQPELDGRAPLEVVVEERLESWARDGGAARREFLAPVVSILKTPAAPEPPPGANGPLRTLVWLLAEGEEGIGLTQTGALNRALVRTSVERFPAWWRMEMGPPHREDEVTGLCEVHDLARRMRLLRKTGRSLVTTKRGRSLLRDSALHAAVAPHLLAADGFAGAVQELAAAALLDGGRVIDRDELLARVHAAIVADGWNATGEPPDVRDVHVYAWNAIRLAEALELLTYEHEYNRETHISRGELTVTPVGREALRLALRARAVD